MKHILKLTIALTLDVIAILGLVAYIFPERNSCPGTLGVPLVGQRMSNWCWAACTEMISRFYNKWNPLDSIYLQCELLKLRPDCKDLECDDAKPFDDKYDIEGYIFQGVSTYHHKDYLHGIIPFDTLKSEFSAGRPVIFQWSYYGLTPEKRSQYSSKLGDFHIGYHYLIAEGCPQSSYSNVRWVSVNNPMPVGYGAHQVMAYSAFAGCIPTFTRSNHSNSFNTTTVYYSYSGATINIAPKERNSK